MNCQPSLSRYAEVTIITLIVLILWLVIDINLKGSPKHEIKKKKFWMTTTVAILSGLYLVFGQMAANIIKNKAKAVNVAPTNVI